MTDDNTTGTTAFYKVWSSMPYDVEEEVRRQSLKRKVTEFFISWLKLEHSFIIMMKKLWTHKLFWTFTVYVIRPTLTQMHRHLKKWWSHPVLVPPCMALMTAQSQGQCIVASPLELTHSPSYKYKLRDVYVEQMYKKSRIKKLCSIWQQSLHKI